MRWEALFGDLQSQYEAAARVEDDGLVVELAEAEIGGVRLCDRLRARLGAAVTLRLRGGTDVRGQVLDVAPQWVLLGAGEGRTLVPLTAVALAWPLGAAAPQAGVVEQRLRVTHVLRALAREGARVRVACDAGGYAGWLIRVGADHLDLRTDPDAGRVAEEVVSLALASVLTVSAP
ncbi:hypothetical protein [Georgenia sp. SYP-B2076]|uniref:hypothetical protein n=1 Tax=Georgenia sp. SYP-B2076 TaxID=2495881 RepID=UPI000F8ED0ED|nr:hypothetical protein [Georgenia sp. SYP-B2076]